MATTMNSDRGQEHLPAEAHELIVAEARHERLYQGEHEEHHDDLEDEPETRPAAS